MPLSLSQSDQMGELVFLGHVEDDLLWSYLVLTISRDHPSSYSNFLHHLHKKSQIHLLQIFDA